MNDDGKWQRLAQYRLNTTQVLREQVRLQNLTIVELQHAVKRLTGQRNQARELACLLEEELAR